jgi:hypothetical protein
MAAENTIAGVSVIFGLPETDIRNQNITRGQAQDKTWKVYKHAASDKPFTISLHGLTTSVKNSLFTALEADADGLIAIHPPAHVDLGSGVGVEVNAQWIDDTLEFSKSNHDFWSGELHFIYVS